MENFRKKTGFLVSLVIIKVFSPLYWGWLHKCFFSFCSLRIHIWVCVGVLSNLSTYLNATLLLLRFSKFSYKRNKRTFITFSTEEENKSSLEFWWLDFPLFGRDNFHKKVSLIFCFIFCKSAENPLDGGTRMPSIPCKIRVSGCYTIVFVKILKPSMRCPFTLIRLI